MRVLLAAKYLHFPQGGGGLERNTHELCLRLAQRGMRPAVMCDLRADSSWLCLRNRIARKALTGLRFPMDKGLGYPVYRGWGHEDGAREVSIRFRPNVVVAQSAEPVPLIEAFKGMGIPRIAYFHEVERIRDADALARLGDVGLLANSEFTASKIAEASGYAAPVIRPLIDPSFYVTETDPKNVLYINTQPRKGVEVAFGLALSRPDVQFDFVTSWNLSDARKRELAGRARAARNITLHQPTNDMRSLYARARLVLAPSQWEEAWGRVATEAQINGIPVLGSDRGGLPEAIGPGGLLIRHDAPIEDWADAFSSMWDDDVGHKRYSAAALAHSQRPEIQPDTIVTRFIEELQAFIGAGG